MTRRRFCRRPYDDRGASLVMALIFITVGSVVLMAVLALADTSMQTTIQLNSRATESADAEGAAQAAINALRKGTYNGNSASCFGTTTPFQVVYQRAGGRRDSARVDCQLDATMGSAPFVMPQQALLTVDATNGIAPLGQVVTGYGRGNSLRVTGPVHANSAISLVNGNLIASGPITARQTCLVLGGTFTPTPTCSLGGSPVNVTYSLPILTGLSNQTVPNCGTTPVVYTLSPGRYTDSTRLSALTSSTCQGGKAIVRLLPGLYFFDFPLSLFPTSAGIWAVTAGTVIAGNLSQGVTLTPGVPPSLPGACKSPVPTGPGWVAPEPGDGVTIVMGATGQLNVQDAGRVEICGTYAPDKLPVAIAAQPTTGLLGALCTTGFPCAALSTGLVVGRAPAAMYVQGTTMLPTREFVISLSPTSQQLYRGGVIARRAGSFSTRDASAPAVIEVVPSNPTAPRRTVVNLTISACPGSPTCVSGGDLQLRAKVAFTDPTGSAVGGARQVSVLSWIIQP